MSNDPPPPYPGGPSAPLIEEKHGPPSAADGVPPVMGQPQGVPIPPPEFGPPPYEPPSQPGFVPPHMPTDSSGPYVPPGAATTVTVLQGEIFQGAPVQTVCPHCQQAITTKITYEIGLMSFLLGFFCCFVGCDLCCCLIPCLFDDFKDVTHTCPNCKAYIYTYKRMC
ncbi:PREDICTED: cell death-inducing p53-target protein 1 isoform X3 [Mesitornis unicolor]|uniref:cell death-inducing p53-target protein 1 isoform X3 n=1 Tax=Mesitornis unicolor TaxID=54374 RepID=UPI0005284BF5|nr:PREDICTED: cell death-inducing p53-target protein 1 isoform X3 [Mesitornis unicolor]